MGQPGGGAGAAWGGGAAWGVAGGMGGAVQLEGLGEGRRGCGSMGSLFPEVLILLIPL